MEILKTSDFYLEQHKLIFDAIINLSNRAQPIDIITLKNELQGVFDNTGGVEYLTEIRLMVTTTANLKHHIKIIEDMAILRRLIRSCGEIVDSSYSANDDVNIILNNAETNETNALIRKTGVFLRENYMIYYKIVR